MATGCSVGAACRTSFATKAADPDTNSANMLPCDGICAALHETPQYSRKLDRARAARAGRRAVPPRLIDSAARKKNPTRTGMTCTSIDAGDQPSHKYTTNPSLPRSTAGNTPNVPTHQDTTPNRLSTLSWVAWVNPPVGLPRHNTTIRHKAACASPNQQAVGDGAARRAQEPRGRSRPSSA